MSASSNRQRGRLRAVPIALAVVAAAFVWSSSATANFGFATFNAEVKKTGKTRSGSGVKKSKRTGKGQYFVHFNRKVHKCNYTASLFGAHGGQISVKPGSKKKRVEVYTFHKSGDPKNKRFYLTVNCNH